MKPGHHFTFEHRVSLTMESVSTQTLITSPSHLISGLGAIDEDLQGEPFLGRLLHANPEKGG